MLSFFQKYQRFLFIFVTVFIVASFAFFGVFDTYSAGGKEPEDRYLTKKVDGSDMTFLEVQSLSKLISSDISDYVMDPQKVVSLCNDGVIREDFIRKGLAELFVKSYFPCFKSDLELKLKRAKNSSFYEHPEASFISAKAVWDRFSPSISHSLEKLKAEAEPTPSTFSHLANLYLAQSSCPPEFVRRALFYFKNQASWVQDDPYMHHADLSVLGCKTTFDWFGKNFIDAAAEFVLNGASLAKAKGYKVSFEEAKESLIQNYKSSMKKLHDMKVDISSSFQGHLSSLGLDEKRAVEAWRSVLLFRKYFEGVGSSTYLDQLTFKDFAEFANETCEVEKYHWPKELQFQSFMDMVSFQVYLDLGFAHKNSLSLPQKELSLSDIEKRAPELVQSSYRLKYRKVSDQNVSLRATVKEILGWQLNQVNWALMVSEFPFLEHGESKEDRFKMLDRLSDEDRKRVDQFAREAWAKNNQELTDEMLQSEKPLEEEVSLCSKWISLKGVSNPEKFLSLLEKGIGNDQSFLKYRDEKTQTTFLVEGIEKLEEKHFLSFKSAKKLGIMSLLTESYLEKGYLQIREKNEEKYRSTNGEWKLFSSVKEEVAKDLFSSLFKSMGDKLSLNEYALKRLEKASKEAFSKVEKGKEEDLSQSLRQFQMEKTSTTLSRKEASLWVDKEGALLPDGSLSSIVLPENGDICFFKVLKRSNSFEPNQEAFLYGKEILAQDTEKYLAEKLLEMMQQKGSVQIPIKEVE